MFIIWSEEFSVGIKRFDDQHKKLIEIINRLYDLMSKNKTHEELKSVISELKNYTEYHFLDEENFQKTIGYNDYQKHKKLHNEFVKKINIFEENFNKNSIGLSSEIMIFLKKWLLNHINIEDKKYGLFYNNFNKSNGGVMKNMSISKKLTVGFGIVTLLGIIVGILGLYNIRKIDKYDTFLYDRVTIPATDIENLRRVINGRRVRIYQALLNKGTAQAEKYLKEAEERNIKIKETIENLINTYNENKFWTIKYNGKDTKISRIDVIEEKRKEIYESLVKLNESEKEYSKLVSEINSMIKNNKSQQEIMAALAKGAPIIEGLLISSDKTVQLSKDIGQVVADKNTEIANGAFITLSIILLFSTIISVILAIYISRLITLPLKAGVEMMEEFSKGHLDKRLNLNTNDEIGRLAKKMDEFADYLQNEVVDGLIKTSKGDLNWSIVPKDDGDVIAPTLNKLKDTINEFNMQLKGVTIKILKGYLNDDIDSSKFSGDFFKMANSINTLKNSIKKIIENTPNPIMIVNKNFEVIYANKTFLDVSKENLENILSKKIKCYEICKTDDCNTDKCAVSKAMRDKIKAYSETLARPNNKEIEISYSAVPIIDDNNNAIGAIEIITDITEIKNAKKKTEKILNYQKEQVDKLVENLNKIANGNFACDLSTSAADDDTLEIKNIFDKINLKLKETLSSINSLIEESNKLTNEASQGNLSQRADASKHQGEFKKLVEGINKLLDTIVDPIRDVSDVMNKVAQKDLTVRIEKNYKGEFKKLADAINSSLSSLEEIIKQVLYATEQVSAAASQISSGAQSLAQAASQQASSIEEITSSIQELSSMSKQNAANAKEGKTMSEKARMFSDEGMEKMKKLTDAIEKIKKSSDETAKIIKTIDEIAFQTNLLALNAAVEAARAGEAGKGFAVVAEEVRNLAMRSAEAAKNTANIIEEALRNAQEGVEINEEVKKKLEEISNQAVKVSQIVSEIAAASEQQDQGIEQINTGITQLNQITQSNAANSEESASASQELSSQAQELMRMISEFKTSAKISASQNTKKSNTQKLNQTKIQKPDPSSVIPFDDEAVLKTF